MCTVQAQQLQQHLQQQPPAVSYKAALQIGEVATQKLIQLDNIHVTGKQFIYTVLTDACVCVCVRAGVGQPHVLHDDCQSASTSCGTCCFVCAAGWNALIGG